VLHRDIKPANLLLDPKGNVWVADFGLAKATDTRDVTEAGDLLGTIRYMAPERFEGKCDARSDVYALGLTLYELLALRPAFAAANRQSLIRQVMHEEPEPLGRLVPHLPRDLETIVAKAIARDPAGRYPTAGALAEDLGRFQDDKPIRARPVGALEQAWRWARRNPVVAGSLGVAMAALLAVTGLALMYANRQARDAERIRRLAVEKAAESRKANLRLAALNYQRGQDECENGEIGPGLLRLVESWRSAVAAGDLASVWPHAARANLAAWQRHQPAFLAVFSHAGPVNSVAFSPDGKTVITGCSDKTARLWDVATGQAVGQTMTHQGSLSDVAFSPDGKTVLTGSRDHTARFWDAATGQSVGPTLTHQGTVEAVAFSPDGKTVITGCTDNTARLWDAAFGPPLGQTLKHAGPVIAVAFSPDGKTVITGSGDRTVRFWDTATGRPTGQSLTYQGAVQAVAFSPDGKTVITGSSDRTARFWDAATGQSLGRTLTHEGPVWTVAFSPDGKTVMTGSEDNTARLWDVASGRPLGPPLRHEVAVYTVAFSPDGKTVITAGRDNMAWLWNAASGRPHGQIGTHQSNLFAVAFSPDGKTVLTGSWDKTARLWDATSGRPLGPPLTHRNMVRAVAFSPDGNTVLTGCRDNAARLWDAATGQALGRPLMHQGPVEAVAFSPDGKTVMTGSMDKTARLWDVAAALPDQLERVATWVEVLTGLELDEFGSARVLDSATWHRRRDRLTRLGGPPVAGSQR
jgi:WD40 repeat protein